MLSLIILNFWIGPMSVENLLEVMYDDIQV